MCSSGTWSGESNGRVGFVPLDDHEPANRRKILRRQQLRGRIVRSLGQARPGAAALAGGSTPVLLNLKCEEVHGWMRGARWMQRA